ncbi:MAG TPA: Gfo/Idh/MocA family oxidoreductase [Bryobacteraceae bacterium]|jgi:predicted dehydrogenase|nr:Gfo/Idh/MocA family oxidoreductase [Bryobacteraceae bacterium]
MAKKNIGIIMNGVTGRMGTNQHLVRSILAIREQGGIPLDDGTQLWPEPILVGRNEAKVRELAAAHGISRFSTNLEACLADPANSIYFDAQTTSRRAEALRAAILAGKHVYCEKPVADSLTGALALVKLARDRGVRHGVVQDKLFLPGIRKLKRLIDSGFFGRMFSIRGEFGYWVFEGDWQPAQRPSWNYRSEDGGGIVVDMLSHWRYVLDHTFGKVKRVSCLCATHIPKRWDEDGKPYNCTAEDTAYASFEIDGGVVAQMNSSWCVRVYRDELLQLQVDGTHGSAVAGLRDCRTQHRANTPKPVWNPDIANTVDFFDGWQEVPGNQSFDNAFKVQWEMFLRHVELGAPFPHDLLEGARGVQLAELALASSREGRWMDVPELEV